MCITTAVSTTITATYEGRVPVHQLIVAAAVPHITVVTAGKGAAPAPAATVGPEVVAQVIVVIAADIGQEIIVGVIIEPVGVVSIRVISIIAGGLCRVPVLIYIIIAVIVRAADIAAWYAHSSVNTYLGFCYSTCKEGCCCKGYGD